MFDSVLVGVDGRQGGRDAIALARLLAAPGAEITLTHVRGRRMPGARAGALALEAESAALLLKRKTKQARISVRAATIEGPSVGRSLQRFAERRGAELLVVGSCHRSLLGRAMLGDDTSHVLNGAPCAVAIAPRGYSDTESGCKPLSRIGVGCDVSAQSAWALRVAEALAARDHATVKALSVVSLQSIPCGEPVPEQWPQIARELVVEERRRISERVGVEGDATYGDPAEELAAFSAQLDLLIVGSRSYGPVGRLFNGSTSNYLARRSRCPLLVLPRSAMQAGGGPLAEQAAAQAG